MFVHGPSGVSSCQALSQHVLHRAAVSAVVWVAPGHHLTVAHDGRESLVGRLDPELSSRLGFRL